jgi:hypothetical protein
MGGANSNFPYYQPGSANEYWPQPGQQSGYELQQSSIVIQPPFSQRHDGTAYYNTHGMDLHTVPANSYSSVGAYAQPVTGASAGGGQVFQILTPCV